MLKEVDRICSLCNIRYNIIAGTLLGAVRHKGYIPWDDDADVAFLREEYEKFRDACEKELDKSRFYFQDHRNTKGYRWGYGKLRRKGTKFLRKHQEHMPYEQGIFIDIFPLDTVSDIKLVRTLQNFHCYCIRKMMWAPVGKIASKGKFFKWWYRCLEKIPADRLYAGGNSIYCPNLKDKYPSISQIPQNTSPSNSIFLLFSYHSLKYPYSLFGVGKVRILTHLVFLLFHFCTNLS